MEMDAGDTKFTLTLARDLIKETRTVPGTQTTRKGRQASRISILKTSHKTQQTLAFGRE
jgi:hypothetical protein